MEKNEVVVEKLDDHRGITIYISHSMVDYETYRIREIAEFLEKQPEIHNVLYAEKDLRGDIDEFFRYTIPKSHMMFFIANKNSIFGSRGCLEELKLALTSEVSITPIKGIDVTWGDLRRIELDRVLGFPFPEEEEFEGFCQLLYNYIKEYIKETIKLKLKEKFNFILDSQDFVNYIRTKNLAKLLKTYDLSIELFYKVLSEISGEQLIPEEPPAIHIFFSYATKNSKDYNIKELSKKLTEYEDIKDAFYWEEDMKGNAMKYMNDCITKSNVLVLFCSPEAKESWLVELEWTSALQKRKVISCAGTVM